MLRTCMLRSLLLTLGLVWTACSQDGGRTSEDDDASREVERDASDLRDGSDTQPRSDAGADSGAPSAGDAGGMDAGSAQSGMDGASADAACTGPSCDPCQLGLYLVADLSGSMNNPVASGSALVGDAGPRDAALAGDAGDAGDAAPPEPLPNDRIDALRNALHAFVDDPATAGTRLGLGHFPHEQLGDAGTCAPGTACTATGGSCCPSGGLCLAGFGCLPFGNLTPSCEVSDYAKPDIELGENDASTFHAAISALHANGQSPEIVALEGSLQYARSKLAARTKVAVVLFADGLWNTCGPLPDGGVNGSVQMGGPVEPLAAVATRYAMGTPAVNTYVVAIKGDPDAGGYFDPVAAAGGTQQAYNAGNGDELLAALKAIRAHAAAACQ